MNHDSAEANAAGASPMLAVPTTRRDIAPRAVGRDPGQARVLLVCSVVVIIAAISPGPAIAMFQAPESARPDERPGGGFSLEGSRIGQVLAQQRSKQLLGEGLQAKGAGRLDIAEDRFTQAISILEGIYTPAAYPNGSMELAKALHYKGAMLRQRGDLDGALAHMKRALAMRGHFLDQRGGLTDLADNLQGLAVVHAERGEFDEAFACLTRALSVRKQVDVNQYQNAYENLAMTLEELGILHALRGDPEKAELLIAESLRMYTNIGNSKIYNISICNLNLGSVKEVRGDNHGAMEAMNHSLQICRRLYTVARFPLGHPRLAECLQSVGFFHMRRGDYATASIELTEALAMHERLFPAATHPQVAESLHLLGELHARRGDYGAAESCLVRSLAIWERLYPPDKFPCAHEHLLGALDELGRLRIRQRDWAGAYSLLARAMETRLRWVEAFASSASEAEAFGFASGLPETRDGLLSAARRLPLSADLMYAQVWRSKAVISRIVQSRQQRWGNSDDPAVKDLITRFQAARRGLAYLAREPSDPTGDEAIQRRGRELTDDKEELERELARRIPSFRRELERVQQPHTDLGGLIRPHQVFVDFIRYIDIEQDPQRPGDAGLRPTPRYMAFVLSRGQPVRRVDLGSPNESAEVIDAQVAAWRSELEGFRSGNAAENVRRLVWDPVAAQFPPGVEEVLLAPDAYLTAVPWAALPGETPTSFLLEKYRISLVPHGPALLESPAAAPAPGERPGAILVVGDVDYGMQPVQLAATDLGRRGGSVIRGSGASRYDNLKASRDEVAYLESIFPADRRLVLTGGKATTAQVEAALPRARVAHFATHAFFSDARERSTMMGGQGARHQGALRLEQLKLAAPTGRNPLLLSGLVLAGANLPVPKDDAGLPIGDGGILSAEVIASLPLSNLDLAVLSACQTAMGRVAGGEGVFSLQRAFHAAGARNVVASLWPVDDYVTSRLMQSFYRKLSEGTSSKAEALRQAQLEILHGPGDSAHPSFWAGWVISGETLTDTREQASAETPKPSLQRLILLVGIFVAVILALSAAFALRKSRPRFVVGRQE
jgi:CHAT domain-containing protein/tetratricopeptide (TPR) repeat protein